MPFEVMDHRGISSSSDLFHDVSFLSERQIGFWKPKIMPDHHDKHHNKAVHTKLLVSLSPNDVLSNESADTDVSDHEKDESIEYKENEVQTIGNFLPDEDDLFSGVIDELEFMTDPVSTGNLDDFDIFCSGGGMELDGRNISFSAKRSSDNTEVISGGQGSLNGSFLCEHPHGEFPSRTLFIRNINNNVEDYEIKLMFEEYGDIRTFYTACKHRGFVMISYYDIRAALNAKRELQNTPLRNREIDIRYSSLKDNYFEKEANEGTVDVYNFDFSISNDEIRQIYGVHGEIKEIRENPHKHCHKFVEYYDVRAAEAALWALNKSDIAKKQIGMEPSLPELRNCINRVIQRSHELAQDESSDGHSPGNEPSSHSMVPPPGSGIINCGFIKSGYIQEKHSAIRVQEIIENKFSQGYRSAPNTFPSGVKACASNQYGIDMPFYSPNQMNFGIAGAIGRQIVEGAENRHIGELGPNGHLPRELSGDGFGSLGKKNSPLHGQPYELNNCNLYQYHPSSPIGWQNLPSLINRVHSHHQPQLHGYPEASSMHYYSHLESSLTVDASIWDRRMAFTHEAPRFHLGSPLNSLENASKLVFSSTNSGLCSPQKLSHIFPARYPVMSVPTSFESLHERMRSSRKDINSNHVGKKQFELDIGRILRGEDRRTTLMLKNIPNKYTSKMLLSSIDEHHQGTYDFIYLPIDFKNKCNVGYAFINIIDPLQIVPFHKNFNGRKWEKFNSEKVASLAYARIQGKSALVTHFQNSSLMNEDKRCRPILFHTDGPNAGDQEPFPVGTNIRSRYGKPQPFVNEGKNQGSPSTSANGEESSHETDSSSGSAKDY